MALVKEAMDRPINPVKKQGHSDSLFRDRDLSDHILNSMPGVFYLIDQRGKFLRWNKNMETITGYSGEEIGEMAPWDLFVEEQREALRGRIRQLFTLERGQGAWTILTKTGKKIPHYFTSRTILLGEKLCLTGNGIDMTEQLEAEERIRISNERYRLATKATNDVIWEWDPATETLFWGEAFYEQFGYTPEKKTRTKKFWETHVHPSDRKRVTDSLNRFIRRKKDGFWSEEYRFRKADGKYARIAKRGLLIFDNNGNVTRVIGAMQDITRKREMEKRLLKQEVDKQKIITRAVVSAQEQDRTQIGIELHDNINQILSTTKLYLDLARTDTGDRVKLIGRSAKNIQEAIDTIRNISKSLVPHSIRDLGLSDSVHDLVRGINATKTIRAEFHKSGSFEDRVPDKLKLVLFRIIQEQVNNVLKHSGASKLVIELGIKKGENKLELNIRDNGRGFDPRKVAGRGGLGLSNIMSRADLLRGTLSIQSAEGRGCQLNLRVPV